MILPVIGFDLGYRPAAVVATGTDNCPVLLATKRWSRWDSEKIVSQIRAWVRKYKGARLWCEETFTERRQAWRYRVKIDVGRVQEGQAGYLEGSLSDVCEVLRVPPVIGTDAWIAWVQFGRPDEGKGSVGEHIRDALGVALKGLIRQGERLAVEASE